MKERGRKLREEEENKQRRRRKKKREGGRKRGQAGKRRETDSRTKDLADDLHNGGSCSPGIKMDINDDDDNDFA